MKLAGITYTIEDDDLVAYDVDGIEIGRTTIADAIMEAERIWHTVKAAAK